MPPSVYLRFDRKNESNMDGDIGRFGRWTNVKSNAVASLIILLIRRMFL